MSNPGEPGSGAARVVMLVRYRPTQETVAGAAHLVPLPVPTGDDRPEVVMALCGRRLHTEYLDTISPGEDLWCPWCFTASVLGTRSTPAPAPVPCPAPGIGAATGTDTSAGLLAAAVAYRRLGWPVALHRRAVSLDLDLDVDAVALAIPTALATRTMEILLQRRCPPPVLAHPALPDHQVIIAGQRYPVPLGWPAGVYRITRTVLLPPTVADRGPVCWIRPPEPDALRLCREIDLVAALRAAQKTPPPAPRAAQRGDAVAD